MHAWCSLCSARSGVLLWRHALRGIWGAKANRWRSRCAALARILLGLFAPGAPWLAFNGPLVLLGIGVGAVIPTISSRAIGAGGLERASLVGGSRFFMCQLAGAAVMLAVGRALFFAASAWHLEHSYARDAIVLPPDQRAAVEEVIAGARSVHALPRRAAREIDELADLVNQACGFGLSRVLFLSAGLVLICLVLVGLFVKPAAPPRLLAEEHTGGSPPR